MATSELASTRYARAAMNSHVQSTCIVSVAQASGSVTTAPTEYWIRFTVTGW